jgi:hypothetical protein
MKKLLCIILVILTVVISISIVCACNKENPETNSLKLIDEVKDKYDNILQQTFYNEKTGDYLIREYTYSLQQKKWVCIDQQLTMIPNRTTVSDYASSNDTDSILKVYYNNDILNGPITIMDNEYAKVTIIKYLARDNWWEFGYELKVVNKTNSILTIIIDDTSIMDTQCKPMFTIDHIEANHTTYFSLCWDKETLERCYIPYIDNIEFMIKVYDNENWAVPALAGEQILIKN